MFSRPWPSIKARPRPEPRPDPRPFEQGSCECGEITVTISGVNFRTDGPQGKLCHCALCRSQSTSHYGHKLTVPTKNLAIEGASSSLSSYSHTIVPGQRATVFFCAQCGCCLATRDSESPGEYYVPLGLFNDVPHPVGELVAYQKVRWLRDKFALKNLDKFDT